MNAKGAVTGSNTIGSHRIGGGATSLASLPGLAASGGFSRLDLIDHLFILRALVLYSIRFKYRSNAFGFFMEYFRIAVIVLAHYLLFWMRNKPMPAELPIEIFVIAAFSVWYAFRDAFNAANGGWKQLGGAMLVPGITRMHVRLAKAVWACLSTLLFCIIATVALNLAGDDLNYPNIALTVAILLLATAIGFGYGLAVEALTRLWGVLEPAAHLTLWLVFVTSGIYFSISEKGNMPILANVMWYNPILHCTEYQRHSFYTEYPVALVTLLYPTICALGLLFVGLALNRLLHHMDHK